MATGGNFLANSPKKGYDAYETYIEDPSSVEEKLFGHSAEESDDKDAPAVFFCDKCKLPVGDSLSWDGSDDKRNHIHLKRVTENVLVSKDARLHEDSKGSPCIIVDLVCRGCQTVLGMIYKSTPISMDHKRYTFCFMVAKIGSYELGTASQMLSGGGANRQPVTLEVRDDVERQLTECLDMRLLWSKCA
ncbi:protein Mis18-alpha isoform X2 [Corythoichthys intestinalis]|uniref:protein Mis18-alpha isoform X2 n=1 Tax=Corythoichthys intestinalis TaxID=161448 RepID=UPI0025A4F766|nr:protein Mis18-alpha isoform X2 [Corythoichthys intestinalis]